MWCKTRFLAHDGNAMSCALALRLPKTSAFIPNRGFTFLCRGLNAANFHRELLFDLMGPLGITARKGFGDLFAQEKLFLGDFGAG